MVAPLRVGILEGKHLREIPSVPSFNCAQIRLRFQSFNKGRLSAINLILRMHVMEPRAKASNVTAHANKGGPKARVRRTPLDPGWQNERNICQRCAGQIMAIDVLGHLPRRGDIRGKVRQMRNWPASGSGPAQDHCLRPWHATQQNEWIAERSAARAKKGGCHWGHGQNGFCVNLKGPDGWADGRARLRRARVAPAKEKPPCVLLAGCRRRVQTSSSERKHKCSFCCRCFCFPSANGWCWWCLCWCCNTTGWCWCCLLRTPHRAEA